VPLRAAMVFLALGFALAPGADVSHAADAPSLESQVKSAFILNFVQFVDWPDGTFKAADDPIVIDVLGADALHSSLAAAAQGKTVKGRKLIVRAYVPAPPGGAATGHVLVTGPDVHPADILKALGPCPVLTIGDHDNFTDAGGVIRFYLEDRKVRFEINLAAAGRARLQISAKLLKLARVVNK
jgi:hypothetical protein